MSRPSDCSLHEVGLPRGLASERGIQYQVTRLAPRRTRVLGEARERCGVSPSLCVRRSHRGWPASCSSGKVGDQTRRTASRAAVLANCGVARRDTSATAAQVCGARGQVHVTRATTRRPLESAAGRATVGSLARTPMKRQRRGQLAAFPLFALNCSPTFKSAPPLWWLVLLLLVLVLLFRPVATWDTPSTLVPLLAAATSRFAAIISRHSRERAHTARQQRRRQNDDDEETRSRHVRGL